MFSVRAIFYQGTWMVQGRRSESLVPDHGVRGTREYEAIPGSIKWQKCYQRGVCWNYHFAASPRPKFHAQGGIRTSRYKAISLYPALIQNPGSSDYLQNIVFYSEPPELWVKIADFGISKHIKEQSPESTSFTWGYQGPEVNGFNVSPKICDGSTIDDSPRDIWALGEICFQMLTKKPTFRNIKDRTDFFNSKNDKKFPVHELISKRSSTPAQNFIREAMKMNPSDRITAEEGLDHKWIKNYTEILSKKKIFGQPLETSMRYAKSTDREFLALPKSDAISFETVIAGFTLPIIFAECGRGVIEKGTQELIFVKLNKN